MATASIRETASRRPRRSRNVRLTTMAAVAGAALTAGCGSDAPDSSTVDPNAADSKQVQVFESVIDCVAKSDLTEEQCTEAQKQAILQTSKEAPRFAAAEDCEADWGQGGCVEQFDDGRHHYSPYPRGFMYTAAIGGVAAAAAMPLFGRAGTNEFRTGNGTRLGYGGAPGKYYANTRALERSTSVPKVRAASGVTSRGGFGDRNSSSSRSGSSRSFGG